MPGTHPLDGFGEEEVSLFRLQLIAIGEDAAGPGAAGVFPLLLTRETPGVTEPFEIPEHVKIGNIYHRKLALIPWIMLRLIGSPLPDCDKITGEQKRLCNHDLTTRHLSRVTELVVGHRSHEEAPCGDFDQIHAS